MEKDLEEMKRRLAQLEIQKGDMSQSQKAGGETQQRQIAELFAGLDNLRVEFQSINGRIDDLGQDNRALNDELQLIKDDLGLQLSSLTTRVDELEKHPVISTVQPPQAEGGQKQPVTAVTVSAEQLYQDALDLIRNQKKFADGRKDLETFVAKYEGHDLYVNALYWIGEAYYGEKKYEEAILQFQDVISKYPKHPKAPAAMLKQALAFNALGDGENARTTMQKLTEEYPDSSQAPAAKKYLEKI
jgi:tol-pal system protein YbgF